MAPVVGLEPTIRVLEALVFPLHQTGIIVTLLHHTRKHSLCQGVQPLFFRYFPIYFVVLAPVTQGMGQLDVIPGVRSAYRRWHYVVHCFRSWIRIDQRPVNHFSTQPTFPIVTVAKILDRYDITGFLDRALYVTMIGGTDSTASVFACSMVLSSMSVAHEITLSCLIGIP